MNDWTLWNTVWTVILVVSFTLDMILWWGYWRPYVTGSRNWLEENKDRIKADERAKQAEIVKIFGEALAASYGPNDYHRTHNTIRIVCDYAADAILNNYKASDFNAHIPGKETSREKQNQC